MFGHQDDDKPAEHDNQTADAAEQTDAVHDIGEAAEQAAPEPAPADPAEISIPTDATSDEAWQQPDASPEEPKTEEQAPADDESIKDAVSPAGGFPKHPSQQYSGNGSALPVSDTANPELLEVRDKALGDLAPLIDKLDLPPEEKFHTIMMIIQTSDDQKLVEAAYEAAHSIEDEKTRGQALLDVINEINYFTQPKSD